MKSLSESIVESLMESLNINEENNRKLFLKLNVRNAQMGAFVEDALRDFINHSKNNYSLRDKQSLKKLFNDFCFKKHISPDALRKLNIKSGEDIALLFINNKEEMEKNGWNFSHITTFNETKLEKEYKKWKESDDYVSGTDIEDYIKNDQNNDERSLVVYYRDYPNDHSTTIVYPFYGSRMSNDHQRNMICMDWHYKTGLPYFKANDILLSNYLKKSENELKNELGEEI